MKIKIASLIFTIATLVAPYAMGGVYTSSPNNRITITQPTGKPEPTIRTAEKGQQNNSADTGSTPLNINAGVGGNLELNSTSTGVVAISLISGSRTGIGTLFPTDKLEVNGDIKSDFALFATSGQIANDLFIGGTLNPNADLNIGGAGFSVNVASAVNAGFFNGDGSGLFNVTAAVPAEIGVSTIDATATTPFGGVNVTTNVFIGGNVGIGTLFPTESLEVNGSIKSDSALFASSGQIAGNLFIGGTLNPTADLNIGGPGFSVNVASAVNAGFFNGDGSGLFNVTAAVPAEISVSTIDATAATPLGGVNFTTNVFVGGNVSVTGGNVGINTPADPLRKLKIECDATQRALKIETFQSGAPADIDYRNGVLGDEWFAGLDGNADFDFYDASPGRHPMTMLESTGFVGVNNTSPAYQLDIFGNVNIDGTLTKSAGSFQIEDPLDHSKLLLHGFVESPEYGLIYRGTAKLKNGEATITLPPYFEDIVSPKSRTVQLTCKNGWSPLYYTDVVNGKFTVKTTREGDQTQEFSWMVQGSRQDPYVKENPFELTRTKPTETIKKSDWDRLTPEQQQMRRWNAKMVIIPG